MSDKDTFNLDFKSLGIRDLYADWLRPMPYERLLKKASRLLVRTNKLSSKCESKRLVCQSRSKSIPANATIRKEYVKCKKPNCHHRKHGPYYYAYWKDPVTKKLKKKYIGRYYKKDSKSVRSEQA